MIPDPLDKTVLIPVKIVDGKVEFFYGGPLPKLKNGVIGDLRVPRYAILDMAFLEKLEAEEAVEILPMGALLGALVNIRGKIADEKKKYLMDSNDEDVQGSLVKISLKEPLKLKLRGTKKGTLSDCPCSVEALPDKEISSINQAYTLISQHFETHRRSHSGNVFEKVYCRDEDAAWQKLGDLRDTVEAKYEKTNFMPPGKSSSATK